MFGRAEQAPHPRRGDQGCSERSICAGIDWQFGVHDGVLDVTMPWNRDSGNPI